MAQPQATSTNNADYMPPPINGDFYSIASVLNDKERALLRRVREFGEGVVAPVIEDYWGRDEFPFAMIPEMAKLGIGGIGYHGYDEAGGSWLLNGFVAMELARVDASVATFWGADDHRPMFAYQGVKTEADGQFALDVEFYGSDRVVMAVMGDRGGLTVVGPGTAGKPAEIKTGPLVEVTGNFTCTEQGSAPGWTNVYLLVKPGEVRFADCTSSESKFRLKVPPGSYGFWGYGNSTDYTRDRSDIAIKAVATADELKTNNVGSCLQNTKQR
jgi:hypothetical protein